MIDLIIGLHSVYHACLNAERSEKMLLATAQSLSELESRYQINAKKLKQLQVQLKLVKNNDFQSSAQKIFQDHGQHYRRLPTQLLLQASAKSIQGPDELFHHCQDQTQFRLLALDRLTDIQNAASLARTAAFFKVDGLLIPSKNSFQLNSGFYRIASGGVEYLQLYQTPHLSRTLSQLAKRDFAVIGLSEEAQEISDQQKFNNGICLVLGAEDTGLSHSVERVLTHHFRLQSQGPIQSLNVSAAGVLAMQLFFA